MAPVLGMLRSPVTLAQSALNLVLEALPDPSKTVQVP